MKKYLFFTSGLFDIGGAEVFTSNKIKFLESKGWQPYVFFAGKGHKVLIENFKPFENNRLEILGNRIWSYSNNKLKIIIGETIKKIKENINYHISDEIIIESHYIGYSLWAELIAKELGARHILNCLEEDMSQWNLAERHFIEFKLKRHEILNGSESSLKKYLGTLFSNEHLQYAHDYLGIPFCSNVTADFPIDLSMIDTNNKTIISIGRLNKPYILPTMKSIRDFVDKYRSNFFNLIIVGASIDGSVEKKIDSLFSECRNIVIHHFGYMFPIPVNLIKMADVGIASSNSIDIPTNEGVPTINIDIEDLKPIGIYKITTQNRWVKKNDPEVSVESLLEDILIHEKYKRRRNLKSSEEFEKSFAKQLEFLKNCDDRRLYYDVNAIYLGKKFRIKRFCIIPKQIIKKILPTQICEGIKRLINKK